MITSSKIIEDSLQAHGQRYIREVHTDHLGREHTFSYAGAKDVAAEKILMGRVLQLEQGLIRREVEEVVKIIEQGQPLPKLEFATTEQVKLAFSEKTIVHEKEIMDLTAKKNNLEAGVA